MDVSRTIPHNTSSAFSQDIDLLAPMIVKGAPLDWEIISVAQPSFDQRVVPKKHRKFFSSNIDQGISVARDRSVNPQDQPAVVSRRITRSQTTGHELPGS